MKLISLLKKPEKCKGCDGTCAQINEFGFIRKCPDCMIDFKVWSNEHGTEKTDEAMIYVDATKKIIQVITEKEDKQGYLYLKDGSIIYLNQK